MPRLKPIALLFLALALASLTACTGGDLSGTAGEGAADETQIEAPEADAPVEPAEPEPAEPEPAEPEPAEPEPVDEPSTDGEAGIAVPAEGFTVAADPKAEARAQLAAPVETDGESAFDADAEGAFAVTPAVADAFVAAHNRWRASYGSPPVTWDANIAAYAQEWADHLLATGSFDHRQNGLYGENLAMAGFWGMEGPPPERSVDDWGSEVQHFNVQCPGDFSQCCAPGQVCGHFTQVIWASSTRIGCGVAQANGLQYVVCNYAPAGNVTGQSPYAGGRAPTAVPPPAEPEPTVAVPPPTERPPDPTAVPVVPTDVPPPPPPPTNVPPPTAAPEEPTAIPPRPTELPPPTAAPPAVPPSGGGTLGSWSAAQGNLGLPIEDNDYAELSFAVTQPGRITASTIGVGITHSYVGDLAIVLIHPDGSYAILRNQTGGSGQNIQETYGKGGIPVAGLDQFVGKPLAGTWVLQVYDLYDQDQGTLDSMKVIFEYQN